MVKRSRDSVNPYTGATIVFVGNIGTSAKVLIDTSSPVVVTTQVRPGAEHDYEALRPQMCTA